MWFTDIGELRSFNGNIAYPPVFLKRNALLDNNAVLLFAFVHEVTQLKCQAMLGHFEKVVAGLAASLLQIAACFPPKMHDVHRFIDHHACRGVFAQHDVVGHLLKIGADILILGVGI